MKVARDGHLNRPRNGSETIAGDVPRLRSGTECCRWVILTTCPDEAVPNRNTVPLDISTLARSAIEGTRYVYDSVSRLRVGLVSVNDLRRPIERYWGKGT